MSNNAAKIKAYTGAVPEGYRQLPKNYIDNLRDEGIIKFRHLKKDGAIIKVGGQYYGRVDSFNESCFTNEAVTRNKNLGTSVEQRGEYGSHIERKDEKFTYSSIDGLIEDLQDNGLDVPTDKMDNLKKLLIKNGVEVDDVSGRITASSMDQLNNALQAFWVEDPITTITFTEGTNEKAITKFQEQGLIGDRVDEQSDNTNLGTYTVPADKKEELIGQFSEIGESTRKLDETKNITLGRLQKNVSITRTKVEVPDDLASDRTARKELKNEYKDRLKTTYVANPEHDATILQEVMLGRHEKELNKEMQKILKNANAQNRPDRIFDKFYNQYATDSQKVTLDALINDFLNSAAVEGDDENVKNSKAKSRELLVNSYNECMKESLSYEELADSESKLRIAAKLAIASSEEYNSGSLLFSMAMKNVADSRTPEEVEKDTQWFIDEQAKRMVKKDLTDQRVENTHACFSSKTAKAADNSDGSKTVAMSDVKGFQKLFQGAPRTFGDEVSEAEYNANKDECIVVNDKTGTAHYFKFSENKTREWVENQINTSKQLTPDEQLPNHEDEERAQKYAKDNNCSLREARTIVASYGKLEDIDGDMFNVAEILGKSDTSNKAVNVVRHISEALGYSTEANLTTAKRVLNTLVEAGLIVGGAAGLGAIGGLGAKVVKTGTTLAQELIVPGQPVNIPGYHTEDTVSFNVDGEIYSKTIIHDVPADTITTDDQSFTAPGQDYRTSGRNVGGAAGTAAATTAPLAVVGAFIHHKDDQAKGKASDAVVNIYNDNYQEDFEGNFSVSRYSESFDVNGSITDITEGEIIENKPCRLVIRKKDLTHNQGDSKKDMVAQYYDINQNDPNFGKIYKYIMETVNNLNEKDYDDVWEYTNNRTYYLPDKIPASITGNEIVRKYDPTSTNKPTLSQDSWEVASNGRDRNIQGANNSQHTAGTNQNYSVNGKVDTKNVIV